MQYTVRGFHQWSFPAHFRHGRRAPNRSAMRGPAQLKVKGIGVLCYRRSQPSHTDTLDTCWEFFHASSQVQRKKAHTVEAGRLAIAVVPRNCSGNGAGACKAAALKDNVGS